MAREQQRPERLVVPRKIELLAFQVVPHRERRVPGPMGLAGRTDGPLGRKKRQWVNALKDPENMESVAPRVKMPQVCCSHLVASSPGGEFLRSGDLMSESRSLLYAEGVMS